MSLTNDAVFLSLDKGGLCNRLMPLAGVSAAAEANGLPLFWYWQNNHVCPGEFSDCFSVWPGTQLSKDDFIDRLQQHENPLHFDKGSNRGLSCTQHWRYYHHWSPLNRSVHFEYGAKALRKIQPTASIFMRMCAIGIDDNTVGVHVRRTDFESKYGNTRFTQENKKLRARLAQLVKEGYSFFVAADSKKSMSLAASAIPKSRLLSFNHDYNNKKRRRHTSMEDAVADLFALSRCRFIIGTNNSSFSICAGALGDKTVEYVYGQE